MAGSLFGTHGRSKKTARNRTANHLLYPGHSEQKYAAQKKSADESRCLPKAIDNGCIASERIAHVEPSLPSSVNGVEGNQTGSYGTERFDTKPLVKLYPDLALGMLRQEVVSSGRIWLLLQHIDEGGRGWVTLSEARRRLTERNAELQICGRRQLRKLFARGEGLFWRRQKDRVWLRSTAKVAASLNVQRLTGSPIALPVDDLLKGIGHVRAHFYASFHSGRNKEVLGEKRANLIARSTLQRISHASRRSQQRYEHRAGIVAQANVALGGVSTLVNDQRIAWEKGTAAFRFRDSAGKVGRRGVVYSAWQLPNNYSGPHATLPKGRQKRINRELADLFMKGMTGNGKLSVPFGQGSRREVGSEAGCVDRLYHKHSLSAAASFARTPNTDAYWPARQKSRSFYHFWFLISGKEAD